MVCKPHSWHECVALHHICIVLHCIVPTQSGPFSQCIITFVCLGLKNAIKIVLNSLNKKKSHLTELICVQKSESEVSCLI
jgi:hypothetical protein